MWAVLSAMFWFGVRSLHSCGLAFCAGVCIINRWEHGLTNYGTLQKIIILDTNMTASSMVGAHFQSNEVSC